LGYNLTSGNSEGCPVSHIVQLDAHLPLCPVLANLFLPELGVTWTKSKNATSIVIAFNVPVAVGDTCRSVDGGNSANW
jgi:hypothetical protein